MKRIALLRGINVGGQRKIKMQDLTELLHQNGYKNIATYIQSGNLVFEDGPSEAEFMKNLIYEKFGFDVPVQVFEGAEWENIYCSNPFNNLSEEFLHVTLLDKAPSLSNNDIDSSRFDPEEQFSIIGKTVYLYCPKGYGRTKMTNDFWEKKLSCQATTRNWKTVKQLREILSMPIEG